VWKEGVWRQFGAAIDMLENAIHACPEPLWSDRKRRPEFWYTAYHTVFYLDFYLAPAEAGFAPPPPFTLSELDPDGAMPDRVHGKPEVLDYLAYGRERCRRRIRDLGEAEAAARCGFERRHMSVFELLLYNLRHVQHHTAQLNLLLRQQVDAAPGWVGQTRTPLLDCDAGDAGGGDGARKGS
jgi:hypothetical protein